MNINLIYRHPCELEIESLLGREEPYPDTFTPADCATERLTRARTGLVHVMNEIIPSVGGEQATVINSWLQKVTSLRDKLMIGAVMSLLNGVPEAIQEADELLGKYELQNHSGEAKHE
uniref:nicotinic acetylcholine receptor subunit beta n=1 Tax=Escherichia coli TaxID=562 RepID=UPI0024E160B5|nr:nicotinic acetylcholine receptor subunit beta [Escherichia coli]